jgi:G3E family GTPase
MIIAIIVNDLADLSIDGYKNSINSAVKQKAERYEKYTNQP